MPEPERYELLLGPGARGAPSGALPPAAAFAAWEFVNGPLRDAPLRVGAPLRRPFEGLWRARRGEYRVRYEIDEAQGGVGAWTWTTAGTPTGPDPVPA